MARRQPTFRKQQHLSAEYGYIVIYERLLEGGYQVIVPALPGIVTYGRTLEEAREMAEDAIRCHIRALLRFERTARVLTHRRQAFRTRKTERRQRALGYQLRRWIPAILTSF